MTNFKPHPTFALKSKHHIEALDITVLLCEHIATGAVHYHLACDHDENAFMIGFATQPMTSRGEAHVLEHVVLCGSQKYPVRDPFFSMIKRSLQTFMNAMTASDWTVYPFASQNKNDYFNLLSVYLDAVFFPNINKLDFAQEGIRLELDEQGRPKYHGIVFNEMKGAMSGEIDQLYYALAPHLYPTTTYHYNSGGDPKEIVKLTYEDLVDFHKAHYHPSNAIIMSFGDIDVAEIQAKLHDDALACFDDKQKPSRGKKFVSMTETRLNAPVRVYDGYTADVSGEKMTHNVLAWLLPNITDPKQRLALRLMEGVLIEHAGSPLRAYLDSSPLGTCASPLLGLDDSHYEMVFYAGVRGSERNLADDVENAILEVLRSVADNPIADETIQTILHQIELDQRHIGGDGMPYGLTLMLEGFSTALHGGNPMDVWEIDEHLSWLSEQVKEPNWVQNLIKTHLLDNPHRVRLTLSPDKDKAQKLIDDENRSLDELNATLNDDDKAIIRQKSEELAVRQALVDDVDILPKVGLDDVPKGIKFIQANKQPITIGQDERTLYEYHAGTNGLYYYQMVLDLDDDVEILNNPLLPLYLGLLSELGTDKYDARTFQAVQASVSSGVTARISQRTDRHDKNKMTSYLVLATRALARKPEALGLVNEVLYHTIFDETYRISELLQQKQASWQSRLSANGHSYAIQTASCGMSKLSSLEYHHSGLPALSALKSFLKECENDKTIWQTLSVRLAQIHKRIQHLPKDVILVCEADKADALKMAIKDRLNAPAAPKAPDDTQAGHDLPFDLLTSKDDDLQKDTAWLIATNVYYNAIAYPATTSGHDDTPALTVLAPFLRNGYLHSAIREKGGAYGGGANFDANSASFRFYSYRDPHCVATFEHFEKSIDWLLDNDHDASKLEEAILGVIGSMDKPASPAGEAIKACFGELHGRTKEMQETMRAKLLAVTIDDLKRVAYTYLKDKPHVKASLAPLEQETQMMALGFDCHKIG
ncbi:peptidase M16 [Moraxella nonliquefaciens]|uniref:insulinase family protein n=1 Tax=Moraxella nonliquefaciens TaxID=478 RepID=UPI0024A77EBE|nr:insulinase family protein [Moraxella nonliquefaciens]MDI4497601.1 peptidase M16 [Moraxella nonliquefaciens]MDI4499626.1 peptidase M16 [Moraxella nonliquefaciens]